MNSDKFTQHIEGPCFGYDETAVYLNCSPRQVHVFEEQGDLIFFALSKRKKATTKGQCDALIVRSLHAAVAKLEGDET